MTMPGTFATRLWSARQDLHWNHLELASRSGVSRQYIGDLERGRITNPGVEIVEAIAAALGVQPAYLLGWTDVPLAEETTIGEGSVPYTVNPNVRALLDLYEDLDPANQAIALEIIRTIRRSQHVHTVGGES